MLEIGTMLSGRYEVLKRVGSGGMADVYMAKDHKIKPERRSEGFKK